MTRCVVNILSFATAFVAISGALEPAHAAEVHSNGTGGGRWSDVATWRGKSVPGPTDSAVIGSGDSVVFDRSDDGKPSCKDLYIDPEASLMFKPGEKCILTIEGPIESYGIIKLDGSGGAGELIEIQFTGSAAQRVLKLIKGGALVAIGRPDLPEGKRNVILRSNPAVAPKEANRLCYIDAAAGTTVDLQHAQLDGVTLRAERIDNTGARVGERIGVAGCLFTAAAAISLTECDTPSILNNSFTYTGDQLATNAISVTGCPLAEIRGNTITGKYAYAIYGITQHDSLVSNNSITDCNNGLCWLGDNNMLRANMLRNVGVGIYVTSAGGAIEDATFDNCAKGLSIAAATVQATNLRFVNVPKDGVRIEFIDGALTLLNCDLSPEQIKQAPASRVTTTPRVQAMQYCVVAVKGPTPIGAAVIARTVEASAPLAKGALDMNIRNAPAEIGSGGLTPLPSSLKSLILKSWQIEGNGKLTPAPTYNVTLIAPPDKPDGDPKSLKSATTAPAPTWYRSNANDPTPTMEMTLP